MACNFLGMLRAPDIEQPPVFIATYSDGFGIKRREITAPDRLAAYAIATRRPPGGATLTGLRKKKAPSAPKRPSLEERVDIACTRALYGIYRNTDIAGRYAVIELNNMAKGVMQ